MRCLFFYSFLICIFAFSLTAKARPVSYPGGWTAITENNAVNNSAQVHYSPSAKYSVGVRGEYFREDSVKLETVQLNTLVKRWNNKDSQANIYAKGGVGIAHKGSDIRPATWAGMSADWENRRLYASYSNRFLTAGDLRDFVNQSARVGVAPYVAEYGKIHTWFMVQVDHNPTEPNELMVTPLVRVFKGNALAEAGINTKGQILFNFSYRF